jgi:hypothetical protein
MKIRQRPWQQDLGKAAARLAKVAAMLAIASGHFARAEGAGQSFAVALPEMEGPVTMGIFSPSGERVRRLYHDAAVDSIPAGLNGLIMTWDGKDDQGRDVPPGTYRARGLVHGPIECSALPTCREKQFLPLPSSDLGTILPALPMTRGFPKDAITLRAARDELLESRPLLTIRASLSKNAWLLHAEGLPLLEFPFPDPKHPPTAVTLSHGSSPGTALLTLADASGSEVIAITGLDKIVPLNAGTLEIQADAFHPGPLAGESAP